MENKINTIEIYTKNGKSEKEVYDTIWYNFLVMNYGDYQNDNLKLSQVSTTNPESHKVTLTVSSKCKLNNIEESIMSIINNINGIKSINIKYYDIIKTKSKVKVRLKKNKNLSNNEKYNTILFGVYDIDKFTNKDANNIKTLIYEYLNITNGCANNHKLMNDLLENPLTKIYDDFALNNNTIIFELYEPLKDKSLRHLKIKVDNLAELNKKSNRTK